MIFLSQIMLYVDDQDKVAKFWKDNFDYIEEERIDLGEAYSIRLSDPKGWGSDLVIHQKEFVRKMNSGANLESPSLMFETRGSLDKLRNRLIENGVTVGEVVDLGNNEVVFNFADPEGNYFAIHAK